MDRRFPTTVLAVPVTTQATLDHPGLSRSRLLQGVTAADATAVADFVAVLAAEPRYFHQATVRASAHLLGLLAGAQAADSVGVFAGAELVGLGRLAPSGGGTAEVVLAVAPSWRRWGIARGLMAALDQLAGELGLCSLTADVERRNRAAVGLARSCGYVVAERGPTTLLIDRSIAA